MLEGHSDVPETKLSKEKLICFWPCSKLAIFLSSSNHFFTKLVMSLKLTCPKNIFVFVTLGVLLSDPKVKIIYFSNLYLDIIKFHFIIRIDYWNRWPKKIKKTLKQKKWPDHGQLWLCNIFKDALFPKEYFSGS